VALTVHELVRDKACGSLASSLTIPNVANMGELLSVYGNQTPLKLFVLSTEGPHPNPSKISVHLCAWNSYLWTNIALLNVVPQDNGSTVKLYL